MEARWNEAVRGIVAMPILMAVACGPTPTATRSPLSAVQPSPSIEVAPTIRTGSPGPTTSPIAALTAAATAVTDDVFEAMIGAIAAHDPAFRPMLTSDRVGGGWRLDGDVDDGLGPGRLFIDAIAVPGQLEADTCGDADFRQGGKCRARALPNGDRLILRDRVEANATVTVVVVLIHPDRSGISAEASNFSMTGVTTRPSPVYTVGELADLVRAIGRRLNELELP